jgi:hypothetical protein
VKYLTWAIYKVKRKVYFGLWFWRIKSKVGTSCSANVSPSECAHLKPGSRKREREREEDRGGDHVP